MCCRVAGGRRRFTKDELATDDVKLILARRQKQIDYGKNTACYAKYLQDVPRYCIILFCVSAIVRMVLEALCFQVVRVCLSVCPKVCECECNTL